MFHLIGKLSNKFRIWKELDCLKTFYYWVKLRHPRCSSFHIFPKSLIRIEKGGDLEIKQGQTLINGSWTKGRQRQYTSQLIISEHAHLIIEDSFGMYQGASIYLGPGATLIIKGKSFINTNTIINCFERISIGEGTAIGDDVRIQDSDNHIIVKNGTDRVSTKPISIGNHCWISKNVIILKGVHIGDGAIIGAGSVVVKDIPARCLAVGNPARVIKENVEWK
jgi:acetyltransferase-like isoleucine patch superfamily enzyme